LGVANGEADGASRGTPRSALRVALAGTDRQEAERIADTLRAEGVTVEFSVRQPADVVDAVDGREPDAVLIRCDQAATANAAIRNLRGHLEAARVVVISKSVTPSGVRRMLDAGGDGLVLESEVESALPHVVRAVCAGQTSVPRDLRSHFLRPALSHREKQILGMVVLGFTNGEIAGRLHLAESTVKSHLSSAFAKLGARSRSEAAALILDPGEGLGPGILAISESHQSPQGSRPAETGA
jgi:DNA-binding NarL/FixJ family response regulator